MGNIANRIKNLRQEKNFKQWQIAKYLDITQQSYSYYEQSKRELPMRHIRDVLSSVFLNFYNRKLLI